MCNSITMELTKQMLLCLLCSIMFLLLFKVCCVNKATALELRNPLKLTVKTKPLACLLA